MTEQLNAASWQVTVLNEGDELERGRVIQPGEIGFRLDGGIELADTKTAMADVLRSMYGVAAGHPLGDTSAQMLVVGNVGNGFSFYGPFPDDDPQEMAYSRMRYLEEGGVDYTVVPVEPLTALTPIDADPAPAVEYTQPAATVAADVEVPGAGTLRKGAHYLTDVQQGVGGGSSYALIGRELIEASLTLDDGTPDWENGSICDPWRGEAEFFYPAVALLRFLNASHGEDTSGWARYDRDEVELRLRKLVEAGLIHMWMFGPSIDGFTVQLKGADEVKLWSPQDADVFLGGLEAVEQSSMVLGLKAKLAAAEAKLAQR